MTTRAAKVVVIDDDPVVLRAVGEVLRRSGHEVLALGDPVEALTVVRDPSIDLVISDIRMPNLSGLDLLRAFKDAQPDVEVILMTGYATVETAVEAVKAGAYDFLTKPFERIEHLSLTVAKALERRALKKRAAALEQALDTRSSFEGLIGQSSQMRAVFKLVETVSPSAATVLIQGESGTGKELIARAIHFRSPRKEKPYVAVNCSALTETLLDSELFGHVKGAFTGAIGHKKGLFEAAHGGTIFLDEIGDIPASTQVRLLRALQEGEVKRVGASDNVKVDVRVIAATNVDLAEAKRTGRFREDLFYRLNVIGLRLPPLRDRPDDVPLLAQHFVTRYAPRCGKKLEGFTPAALEALTLHAWPGNVRELENAIERAVVLAPGPRIEVDDLPNEVREAKGPARSQPAFTSLSHLPFAQAKALTVTAFENRYVSSLLDRCGNNISQAALAAGMDRSNFRRLMKEHGIKRQEPGVDAAPEADAAEEA